MPEKEHAAGGKPAAAAVSESLGGSAHPHDSTFAPGVQALWQNRDHDQPVTIRAYAGEQDGQHWYWIEGSSTALPAAELRPMPAPSSNGASAGDMLAEINDLLAQARVEPADILTAAKVAALLPQLARQYGLPADTLWLEHYEPKGKQPESFDLVTLGAGGPAWQRLTLEQVETLTGA